MDKSVEIKKTVFNNTTFNRVVDRSFNTYVLPPVDLTDDVATFFRLYEELFYVIDVLGETDSHEYIVKKSSELLDFDTVTQDIQPLLDEIAQLREENLALSQEILTLQTTV
jgi:hypothetical protein